MDATPKVDEGAFPGGDDAMECIAAVKLAAMRHLQDPPFGELESAVVQRFLQGLLDRHPDGLPSTDPYEVRVGELVGERRSLLHSHLKLSWFRLAYWSYGLIAVRAGLSIARVDSIDILVGPMHASLLELGIRQSPQDCIDEIERFLPLEPSPRGLEAATHAFLSFVRFLHRAALRRRRYVWSDLALPGVGIAHAAGDAQEAQHMARFLSSHDVSLIEHPDDAPAAARLLVLLSREAIAAPAFWQRVAAWKPRPVIPMVVCLMPKSELYRDAPAGVPGELWDWLGDNVAVELGTGNDRYVVLLRALDAPDPRQWWWQGGDAIEIGLAVDVLGEGLPRPRAHREAREPPGAAYPIALDGTLLAACLLASERLARANAPDRDARYFAICDDLLALRQKAPSEPYGMAWFILIYRAWLAFAERLPGGACTPEDTMHAEQEMRQALFALGIGSEPAEVPAFLQAFAQLPWPAPAASFADVDERMAAFLALVYQLANAALARGQRMRLQHPAASCFISYARPDEALARELVTHLEAKGADVWWDLHAITLGAPLDDALRLAVQHANCLFLIATPAADRSAYVRLEVETAIRQGLRIVPVAPDGRLPPGCAALRASNAVAFEPLIPAADADRAAALAAALARLQRTPPEQLAWLQAQVSFRSLRAHLSRVRQ